MGNTFSFEPLLIIALISLFIPILLSGSKGMRIPAVVGEIGAGVILGTLFPELFEKGGEWLDFLSLFGFLFLIFLAGTEIDLNLIRSFRVLEGGAGGSPSLKNPLLLASLSLFLVYLSALGAASLYHRFSPSSDMIFTTLILSTTSLGVVVPVLKERGEISLPLGQTILLIAILADFSTIFFITLYGVYLRKGVAPETGLLALVILSGILVYLGGRRILRVRSVNLILNRLSHASSQIKVRASLFVIIFFLFLSSAAGVETVFGAFIAGAIVSNLSVREKGYLHMKLDAIGYGFFIPIFFVMVGVNFGLSDVLKSPGALLAILFLVVSAFAIKILPSLLLTFRFSLRGSLSAGFLLSSRLSLIIAAAEIGRSLGIIDDAMVSSAVIIAVLTCILSPVIYSHIMEREPHRKKRIAIVGAGKIGRELALRLLSHHENVVIMDRDEEAIQKARRENIPSLLGDADDPGDIARLELSPRDIMAAVTGKDMTNLGSCLAARRLFGVEHLIARDNNPANAPLFKRHGIKPMNLVFSAAVTLENLVRRPDMIHLITGGETGEEVEEITVMNPGVANRRLRDLPIISNGLVILIHRGDDILIPHGDTALRLGDRIIYFGDVEATEAAKAMMEGGEDRGEG